MFPLEIQVDILQDHAQAFLPNAERAQFWTGRDRPSLAIDRGGNLRLGCAARDQHESCDRYEGQSVHFFSKKFFNKNEDGATGALQAATAMP
jgi:hypothetical protein